MPSRDRRALEHAKAVARARAVTAFVSFLNDGLPGYTPLWTFTRRVVDQLMAGQATDLAGFNEYYPADRATLDTEEPSLEDLARLQYSITHESDLEPTMLVFILEAVTREVLVSHNVARLIAKCGSCSRYFVPSALARQYCDGRCKKEAERALNRARVRRHRRT